MGASFLTESSLWIIARPKPIYSSRFLSFDWWSLCPEKEMELEWVVSLRVELSERMVGPLERLRL